MTADDPGNGFILNIAIVSTVTLVLYSKVGINCAY